MKFLIRGLLSVLGIAIFKKETARRLIEADKKFGGWENWGRKLTDFHRELGPFSRDVLLPEFKSQLGQDYLAFLLFGSKGYFVEFGAAHGIYLSNSFALEQIGWTGILAEPSRKWHRELERNRPNSMIFKECVWKTSGESMEFVDAKMGELSTIKEKWSSDHHKREEIDSYTVETISLKDMLDQAKAPKFISYLSIDTEGSEFEILNAFDFESYNFGLITVEHNYTEARTQLYDLLSSHGYVRILTADSLWDDWYVHNSLRS
jgi:FkbM family methyltransferase